MKKVLFILSLLLLTGLTALVTAQQTSIVDVNASPYKATVFLSFENNSTAPHSLWCEIGVEGYLPIFFKSIEISAQTWYAGDYFPDLLTTGKTYTITAGTRNESVSRKIYVSEPGWVYNIIVRQNTWVGSPQIVITQR